MIVNICFFLLLFGPVVVVAQLGWNDICFEAGDRIRCNIWNGNPAPYNSIEKIANGPWCAYGCDLFLNPYDGACTDLISCNQIDDTKPITVFLSSTIIVKQSNITFLSFVNTQRVKIQNTEKACTMFIVKAANINFQSLDFSPNDNCLLSIIQNSAMSVPIVYINNGGDILVSNIVSASNYATVLIVSPPVGLNVGFDDLITGPTAEYFLIILEAVDVIFNCFNRDGPTLFFLGTSSFKQVYCPDIVNVTALTNGYLPRLTDCPEVETIQIGPCPNSAVLPILICTLIVIILIAIIPFIFNHFDLLSRKAHRGVIQTRSTINDDDS